MYKIPEHCNKIRIDVGLSYNAPISRWWLENIPDVFVIGIEPNPHSIANIKCFNTLMSPCFVLEECAISDTNGEQQFYITQEDPGCSSLYKPKNMILSETIIVKKQRLDSILTKLPDNQIIELLKTDTQGEDYNIMESLIDSFYRFVFIDCELTTKNQYEVKEKNIFNLMIAHDFELYSVSYDNGRFINKKYKTAVEKGKYSNITIPIFS